jgi:hypothetical protein
MNKINRRDWDIMKRPVYPNVQFVSQGEKIQVQSMLGLMVKGEEYYIPLIYIETVNEISDFYKLTEKYVNTAKEIADKYLTENINIEEDENVFKVTEE